MPVKMVALRPCYHNADSKEYKAGESFSVENDREADRLVRKRRAKRDETVPAPKVMKRPVVETKVMTAVEETPVAAPVADPVSDPVVETRSNRYRRADLRSEN